MLDFRVLSRAGLTICLLGIAACGSVEKRAKESLEKGDYANAVELYEKAAKDDPKDPEIMAGMKTARAKLVEQRLVQVRKARQGGNGAQALDLLVDTLAMQARWKMPAMNNAAFTQEEEMGHAVQTASGLASEAIRAGHPLLAEWRLNRYETVFQGRGRAAHEKLLVATREAGRKGCDAALKKDLKAHPWYGTHVARVCNHWKAGASLAGKLGDPAAQLYKNMEVDAVQAATVPPETVSYAREALGAALRRTAWYDPKGTRVLKLALSGRYSRDDDRVQVAMQHEYQEQESYVEEVDVRKSRQIPRQVTQNNVTKTVYDTQYYTVREPQQKTRSITKQFPYGAWKLARRLDLAMSVSGEAEGRALAAQLEDKLDEDDHEHSLSVPKIGLKPHKARLTEPGPWLRARVDRLSAELDAKLGSAWADLYCLGAANGGEEAEADSVMRCLRQKQAKVPAFADQWFRNHTGLPAADALAILSQ
ncbi:MAG: hypothetical protein IT285_02395 [Bdellovibrionales bacterium]|nr:hypothetical protein [Bdellovibrionales bacterium]